MKPIWVMVLLGLMVSGCNSHRAAQPSPAPQFSGSRITPETYALALGMPAVVGTSGSRIPPETYALARQLDLGRIPYAWAMDQGDRCKVITAHEYNVLDRAWNQVSIEDRNRYGPLVFILMVAYEDENTSRSEQFPCSDARQLIDTMLKAAERRGIN